MMERVVEITGSKRHLSLFRGFMVIKGEEGELGRVALDDIGVVVAAGYGITMSNELLVALAGRGAGFVVCNHRFEPTAWLLPVSGHHQQSRRMQQQLQAGKPLKKRLWQSIIQGKIRFQAEVLAALQISHEVVASMAQNVRSGDPGNLEAQAARRYWPLLMGKEFRRDPQSDAVNSMLDYGYTILRSCAARAVTAAGLHPSLGIHHYGPGNPFCLADDIMEPFRPVVDLAVVMLRREGREQVDRDTKARLVGVLLQDTLGKQGTTPVATAITRLVVSVAHSFENSQSMIELPEKLVPNGGIFA
ncbi:MAG: type II CRISPR-associated endonuclease Cas1 [Magnetococcales bacterium]|nr:type II CRISPR-associated endonuclease Cas1 [Magnetococcales bacterium]